MTITSEHLATIRARYSEGVSRAALAREYDVAPHTIKRVVSEPDYAPPWHHVRWTKQRREVHRQRGTERRDMGINAKLTADDVRAIKARLASGERADKIAEQYEVSVAAISLIRHRKRWKDVHPMKYHYRLFCPDCTYIDPMGCFDGGTYTSEEAFDTPEEAQEAGYKATFDVIWGFEVVDEEGKVVEVGEGQRSG